MSETLECVGRYRLWQSKHCFKLGSDSVQLARFATLKKNWRVCDLGSGIGTLLILLSEREETLHRFGVEVDERASSLARHNLHENGLSGEILTADLRTRDLFPPDSMQLVLSNPPYFKTGTGESGGRARMDECCTVEDLCAVAGRLLRTGGRFALVFRPERLAELFAALQAARLSPKRLQLLSHRPSKPPYAVLLEAVKDGGSGLHVLPTCYQDV